MPKNERKRAKDFGGDEGGNAEDEKMVEDFQEEEMMALTDKKSLVGKVVIVDSWKARTGDNGSEYLIFRGTYNGKNIAFSSGMVMKDQAEQKNGPFRARIALVTQDADGVKLKYPYFKFASPK